MKTTAILATAIATVMATQAAVAEEVRVYNWADYIDYRRR